MLRQLIFLVYGAVASAVGVAEANDGGATTCALSSIAYAQPTKSLSGWWYVNSDETIWAGWDAVRMSAGPGGNKVAWLRPKGTELMVSARRLDAQAPAAQVEIPCCYGGRFQASGLIFPSSGCWEVSAKAGSSKLTFVTLVAPAIRTKDNAA